MAERNYIVVEVYPNGMTRAIAQVSDLDSALMLLGELTSRYYDPHNLFAIRTIYVTDGESVHRYENEKWWIKNSEFEEEEKEDESC